MKKLLAILMSLALLLTALPLACAEQSAEAPSPDPWSGVWQCDRCSIEIIWEEEGYRVLVHWGSSAWECTEWSYACYVHEEEGTLVSTPFGIRSELVFGDDGEPASVTDVYNDGEAVFSLDEEGYLIWQDEKENAGEGMRFEWVSEILLTEEEADG